MKSPQRARLLAPTPAGIEEAARVLVSGGLCAFPTETVYGLGADALNESAVLQIFRTKRRPLSDPLIVHVASADAALELVDLPENSEGRRVFSELTSRFWPGPLTLVAPAKAHLPKCLSAGTATVGVRCPAHPLALALLREADVPVAAPSANLFGHVSPTSSAHVLDDLGDQPIAVLDGDLAACEHGIESTVCKIEGGRLLVYRRGAVTREDLEGIPGVTSVVVIDKFSSSSSSSSSSQSAATPVVGEVAPGQLLTHYAPRLPAFLTTLSGDPPQDDDDDDDLAATVVIDFGRRLAPLERRALAYRDLSEDADAKVAANTLFDALRWAEAVPDAARVLIADLSEDRADAGLVAGVADRVYRAASGKKLVLKPPPPPPPPAS
ncbi:hypothetical protein CTAYLR_005265 [Chrysophaeum taylorii]|uniref:Threonylcarbamoyl-AMP synthase n=1 Tax=Chrysophaeum taylorii TaxID=2483200 RepID=A0AAD7UJ80_9STRA|nr:hypothetical protein CTAYLR_005265 [Chrysophaeum taylorii]